MSAADHETALRAGITPFHDHDHVTEHGEHVSYEVDRHSATCRKCAADTALDALVGLLRQGDTHRDFYDGAFCGVCGVRYPAEASGCVHDEGEMIPGSDLPGALGRSFEQMEEVRGLLRQTEQERDEAREDIAGLTVASKIGGIARKYGWISGPEVSELRESLRHAEQEVERLKRGPTIKTPIESPDAEA